MSIFLSLNLILINKSIAIESPENKLICDVHFNDKDSPCRNQGKNEFGIIDKSYLINFDSRIFFLKFNTHGERYYQELFSNESGKIISEIESVSIDKLYDPNKDSPILFKCAEERKTCQINDTLNLFENTQCKENQTSTPALSQPIDTKKANEDLNRVVENIPKEQTCSEERKAELKRDSCGGKDAWKITSDCFINVFKGALQSLSGAGAFIYDALILAIKLPVSGFDFALKTNYAAKIQKMADMPISYIKNWWTATEDAENKSSDIMSLMAFSGKESIEKVSETIDNEKKEDGKKENGNLYDRFVNYIFNSTTESYGCMKWSGVPYGKGSKCLEPFVSWECSDCGTKANVFCGASGFLVGEVGAAYILGGFFQYLVKGVKPAMSVTQRSADKMQNYLSRLFKPIPPTEQVSLFNKTSKLISGSVILLADKISKAKNMPIDFLLNKIRAGRLYVQSKISPSVLAILASSSLHAPNEAAKWYWRKLEIAFAKGVGSNKEKEILKEHAGQDLDKAKKVLLDAEDALKNGNKSKTLAVKSAKLKLAAAEERYRKALAKSDIFELKNLREQFANTSVKSQIELANRNNQVLNASQLEAIRNEALIAGEIEQGKNLLISFKGLQVLEKFPNATYNELLDKIAPILHQSWQESRKASKSMIDSWLKSEKKRINEMPSSEKELFLAIEENITKGKYPENIPRIKPTKSAKDFKDDQAVDIANTSYNELPRHWQNDNIDASKNILDVLVSYQGKDKRIYSSLFLKIKKELDPKDPNYLLKMAQLFNRNPSADDPLIHAAARELNKWKERTGTTYSKEVQAIIAIQAYQDITGTKDSTQDFVDNVIKTEK